MLNKTTKKIHILLCSAFVFSMPLYVSEGQGIVLGERSLGQSPVLFTKAELKREVCKIAFEAGQAILAEEKSFESKVKADGTPVTSADMASQRVIFAGLKPFEFRVVSEEDQDVLQTPPAADEYWWVVDPLDGTKEFQAHTAMFAVNIGLIYAGRPVLGVVYFPRTDRIYYGEVKHSSSPRYEAFSADFVNCALKGRRDNPTELLSARPLPVRGAKVLVSPIYAKDHESLLPHLTRYPDPIIEGSPGTSKFTRLIDGADSPDVADVHLQPHVRVYEWDTAAPHAMITAVGGDVIGLDGQPIVYGKSHLKWSQPPHIVQAYPK